MSPLQNDLTQNEEALIINEVLHGDVNAYKKIIAQNQKLVAALVYKMVHRKEDREDLCQEIFLKVYEKLNSFRFQSKLSTWIANIAFNHCINFLKKKKTFFLNGIYKDSESDEENIGEDYASELRSLDKNPDQLIANKELSLYLQKSMESLSLIQKTIVHFFHQNDFSLDEIATITGLPLNTVKSHLFRARTILKSEMLKYLNH